MAKRTYILNSFCCEGECIFFDRTHRLENENRLWDILPDSSINSLASHLKITRQTMSNILNGKTELSLKMAIKIADICNVSVDRIIVIEKALGNLK